jgi:hypothetical protein
MVVGALTTARSGLVSRSGGSQCGARGDSPRPYAFWMRRRSASSRSRSRRRPESSKPSAASSETSVGEFSWDAMASRSASEPLRRGRRLGLASGVVNNWRDAARSPSRMRRTRVRVTISATRDRRRLSRASGGSRQTAQPPPKRAPAATSSRPPKRTMADDEARGLSRAFGGCLGPSC